MDISWQRRALSFLVSLPCKIRTKRKYPSCISKIMALQWDYMGDLVATTPALMALRAAYPISEISLVTSPGNKSYIANLPFINKVIFLSNPLHLGKSRIRLSKIIECISIIRKDEYDLVVEFTGRLPNQIFVPLVRSKYAIGQDPTNNYGFLDKGISSKEYYEVDRNLDVISLVSNVDYDMYRPKLWNPCSPKDREETENIMHTKGVVSGNRVVIHATASWAPRQWPLERWVEVIKHLVDNGKCVLLIGGPEDKERNEGLCTLVGNNDCINLAGLLNIKQSIALMETSEIFIGNDSGPMHLAAIAKLKGIVLFGPGNPKRWSHPLHQIIYMNPSCGPCPQFAFNNTCLKRLNVCKGLIDIKVKEVIVACERLLNTKNLSV